MQQRGIPWLSASLQSRWRSSRRASALWPCSWECAPLERPHPRVGDSSSFVLLVMHLCCVESEIGIQSAFSTSKTYQSMFGVFLCFCACVLEAGGGRACTVIAAGGVLEDRSAPDMFALLSKRLLSVVPQATLKLPQVRYCRLPRCHHSDAHSDAPSGVPSGVP